MKHEPQPAASDTDSERLSMKNRLLLGGAGAVAAAALITAILLGTATTEKTPDPGTSNLPTVTVPTSASPSPSTKPTTSTSAAPETSSTAASAADPAITGGDVPQAGSQAPQQPLAPRKPQMPPGNNNGQPAEQPKAQPVVPPAQPAPPVNSPAPTVEPPVRTQGLNQSLASINDRRIRAGLPPFGPVTPACSPNGGTVQGTRLDIDQHTSTVLKNDPNLAATFVKGPIADTLTVYQC
jgi:hypothetical protein